MFGHIAIDRILIGRDVVSARPVARLAGDAQLDNFRITRGFGAYKAIARLDTVALVTSIAPIIAEWLWFMVYIWRLQECMVFMDPFLLLDQVDEWKLV